MCSLLLARPASDADAWPRSAVVGIDGSAHSAAAMGAALLIAERFGTAIRAVASTKDQLDDEAAQAIASELERDSGGAVDVLVEASRSADLVVVGHRGLQGLRALGSVSERVAHQADASVLVVRAEDV
jgi:nucleotide-binding universal stress UspA family protein